MANMLPQANTGLNTVTQGVHVGEGLPAVPAKVAVKIGEGLCRHGGAPAKVLVPAPERVPGKDGTHKVQDIFAWLQCFVLYTSIRAPENPELIPELMAYQSTIVRASQDYAGLAWMQYDSAFHRQVALTGLTHWSAINPTSYTLCFTGCARTAS